MESVRAQSTVGRMFVPLPLRADSYTEIWRGGVGGGESVMGTGPLD